MTPMKSEMMVITFHVIFLILGHGPVSSCPLVDSILWRDSRQRAGAMNGASCLRFITSPSPSVACPVTSQSERLTQRLKARMSADLID